MTSSGAAARATTWRRPASVGLAFGMALLLVFLVLAAQFEAGSTRR